MNAVLRYVSYITGAYWWLIEWIRSHTHWALAIVVVCFGLLLVAR
jgi:hypothetical protein